jgi:hypothetical protein
MVLAIAIFVTLSAIVEKAAPASRSGPGIHLSAA